MRLFDDCTAVWLLDQPELAVDELAGFIRANSLNLLILGAFEKGEEPEKDTKIMTFIDVVFNTIGSPFPRRALWIRDEAIWERVKESIHTNILNHFPDADPEKVRAYTVLPKTGATFELVEKGTLSPLTIITVMNNLLQQVISSLEDRPI